MISLFKVFSDEAHNMRSGSSEIDDGTDKKASDSQRGN
jgi:hypothetical protein